MNLKICKNRFIEIKGLNLDLTQKGHTVRDYKHETLGIFEHWWKHDMKDEVQTFHSQTGLQLLLLSSCFAFKSHLGFQAKVTEVHIIHIVRHILSEIRLSYGWYSFWRHDLIFTQKIIGLK